MTVEEYQSKDEESLNSPRGTEIHVVVKYTLRGDPRHNRCIIYSHEKIRRWKKRLESEIKLDANSFKLIYNGKELNDYETVHKYDIIGQATVIQLVDIKFHDSEIPPIPADILVNRHKYLIQEAFSLGSVQICPNCNRPGVKDYKCTHINCYCNVNWCYYCCKTEAEHPNPTQCPLYLHKISFLKDEKYVDSGPRDERIFSFAVFHRLKIIRLLHDLYTEHKEKFIDAYNDLDPQLLVIEEKVVDATLEGKLKLNRITLSEVEKYKELESFIRKTYPNLQLP